MRSRLNGAPPEQSAGPVALIGHSRGGMLSWAMAPGSSAGVALRPAGLTGAGTGGDVPPRVHSGRELDHRRSPPQAPAPPAARPRLQRAGLRLRLHDDLRRWLSSRTRVMSIFSREDQIVSQAASRVPFGENIDVSGSHGGLAHNRAVYPHLARFLRDDLTDSLPRIRESGRYLPIGRPRTPPEGDACDARGHSMPATSGRVVWRGSCRSGLWRRAAGRRGRRRPAGW